MNDIDIDKIFGENLKVKPLTDGLGFHHDNPKEKTASLRTKQKTLQEDLENRNKVILQKQKRPVHRSGEKAMMGDLSAFYEESEVKKIKPVITEKEIVNRDIVHVSLADRFFAFFLDLFVVSFMFITIVVLSVILSPLPQNILMRGFLDYSFVIDGAVLYSLLFIFYFSFLDKTSFSTIGKNLLGIKLMSIKGRVSLANTFIRATATYFGLLTLGLSSILGINDMISKTQLVKR
jgi:uncharacterized RDD family membrane protein YckC